MATSPTHQFASQRRRRTGGKAGAKRVQKRAVLTSPGDGRGHADRRLKCQCCSGTFRAQRATAKYCSERCRKRAYRARHNAAPVGEFPQRCDYCQRGFWTDNTTKRHCSASCRTMASRARRQAAVFALAELGMSLERAGDLVELQGLAPISAALASAGFVYDGATRAWKRPMALPESLGTVVTREVLYTWSGAAGAASV